MTSKSRTRIAARAIARRIISETLENRLLLSNTPSINTVTPSPNATGVALNAPITATLNLPNGGLDPLTVINANVMLYPLGQAGNNQNFVPATVNTTGGGDAIILTPQSNLQINTTYTFNVTSNVKDVHGDALAPYSENFTTGSTLPPVDPNFAFTQVALPTTNGVPFTDVQIGPDGRLYASTEDGRIFRYVINNDGTLGVPQIITSLQTANAGTKRLISGFAFDPSFVANPTQPMLWVSNTFYALSGATNGPNFTGKLTVMSGLNLDTVTDAIVNLPRSVADHVNDQPVFKPGTRDLSGRRERLRCS